MTFPFKFNIVSGILAGFVVIALLFATTPGGFGVTGYDRKEALGAAAVFAVICFIVLWTTGRKPKIVKMPPHVYPPPTPPPGPPQGPGEMLAFLPFLQPTPMMETPLAFQVLGVFLILAAAGLIVWLVKRKGAGPKSGRP